jgi:hypothetical protein
MKGSRSWLFVCGIHGVASSLLWWARDSSLQRLTWHYDTVWSMPWTLWTSAWVHVNPPHLIFSQMGLGLLVALAWVLRPPWISTWAWLLSWPLAQACLVWWPQIGYAAGLSGLMHAGVAVLAVHLLMGLVRIPKGRRWGSLLLLALLVKLAMERGWAHPVVWDGGTELSVVQALNLTSALWGAALALVLPLVWRRWRARQRSAAPAAPSPEPLSQRRAR